MARTEVKTPHWRLALDDAVKAGRLERSVANWIIGQAEAYALETSISGERAQARNEDKPAAPPFVPLELAPWYKRLFGGPLFLSRETFGGLGGTVEEITYHRAYVGPNGLHLRPAGTKRRVGGAAL